MTTPDYLALALDAIVEGATALPDTSSGVITPRRNWVTVGTPVRLKRGPLYVGVLQRGSTPAGPVGPLYVGVLQRRPPSEKVRVARERKEAAKRGRKPRPRPTRYRDHGTGSLQLLDNGKWRSQLVLPDGKRLSRTHHVATKGEAQKAHDRFRAQVEGGEITGDTHTLADALHAWLQSRGPGDIKASTRHYYARTIDSIAAAPIAATRLEKLTTYQLDRFYASLPTGARDAHVVIRQALSQAVRWGWIGKNVALDARAPAKPRARVEPPTAEQYAAILRAINDPQRRLFVELAALTGARRGELCALTWGQVDLKTGALLIDATMTRTADGTRYVRGTDTKTGTARAIAIGPDMTARLKAHRAELANLNMPSVRASAYVFSDTAGQDPWKVTSVSKWFRRYADTAGFAGRLHDLRHKHVTDLFAAGFSVPDVARRAGHRQASTTLNTYAHAIPANDQRMAEAVERRQGAMQ